MFSFLLLWLQVFPLQFLTSNIQCLILLLPKQAKLLTLRYHKNLTTTVSFSPSNWTKRLSPKISSSSLGFQELIKHLRSQKNCCCSYELQLPSENRHAGKKPVQEVHRQVQSLCPKLILFPYFHQPVDQDGTHSCCDIRLLSHVVGLGPESYLFGESWRIRTLTLKRAINGWAD